MDRSHLLILEDHIDTRLLIEYIIEHNCSKEWSFTFCSTCADARAAIREEAFDLLVLDICLPDGAGCEVLRFARHHAASCNTDTPAVAITAMVYPDQRERLLHNGFDGYLPKPFCKTDLLSLIQTHLTASPAS